MRNAHDVLRSLQKYLALALGPEWEVRFAVEEGDFERPFCRVTPSTPTTVTPRGMHYAICRRTFAAVCFPLVMASEEDARMEADRIEEVLFQAFARGLDESGWSQHSLRGHPMRVPLYDFQGMTPDDTIAAMEAVEGRPRRQPNDFVRVVEAPTFGAIPDINEDRAYIVTADLRVEWERSVAVPPVGQIAEPPGAVGTPVPPGP